MLNQQVQQFQKAYKKFRTYGNITDSYWRDKLTDLNISPSTFDYNSQTQQLFFKPLEINLIPGKNDFLLNDKCLYQAKTLKRVSKAKFYINNQNNLILEIDGVKVIIENEQEIGIIYDIFYVGLYNFVYDKPVIVLDIGMNVGFASLYFAHRSNVKAVLSYEPLKITYDQAFKNYDLNPELSAKIEAFNYGLGDKEETLEVEFDYNLKGSIGSRGIDPNFKSVAAKNLRKEKLYIKGVEDVFTSILEKYEDLEIVVKMDCEGAEYPILETLSNSGQLNRIKIIVMEWHKKGPETIIAQLQKSGFSCFSRLPQSNNVGFIQAVRDH